MPSIVREYLVLITSRWPWMLVVGAILTGSLAYASWKADGHAFVAREALTSVAGKVTEASEVTVKGRRRVTQRYYEIKVATPGGEQKLHIEHGIGKGQVQEIIDENITALVDTSDNNLAYEVQIDGKAVFDYERTKTLLQGKATAQASSSGPMMWLLGVGLLLAGILGAIFNGRLQAGANPPADSKIQAA